MKTLEEEAREYAKELVEARVIKDYQSGWMESVYLYITRNSKWVQAEKIRAQIEVLESHIEHPRKPGYKRHDVIDTIKELNKQLKELEDEC